MKKRNIALALGGAAGAAIAVKMLTRAKGVDWEDVREHVPHAERSRFVAVDGARIHYQEFGDRNAPTLLLIHGYTASVYAWKSAVLPLADAGFHVVAVDLIGFGYSEKPGWFDYSIASQARMVARFMNRLGIGRATLVGSSYGGAVAATLALDYPERVEKLVLVDAVINDELRNHPLMRLASVPGLGEALVPFMMDSRLFHRSRMHTTLSPANHHLVTGDRVDSVRRPLSAADAHRSILATSRNWHAERIERDAYLIDHPTLIVWGEDDKVIPIANGYKLHGAILNSRFVVIRDCGHVPQEERTDLFTRVVTEFVRDPKGRIAEPTDDQMRLEPAA
jgi:pimeloyl-ACP methyl ester carboxylesterase